MCHYIFESIWIILIKWIKKLIIYHRIIIGFINFISSLYVHIRMSLVRKLGFIIIQSDFGCEIICCNLGHNKYKVDLTVHNNIINMHTYMYEDFIYKLYMLFSVVNTIKLFYKVVEMLWNVEIGGYKVHTVP